MKQLTALLLACVLTLVMQAKADELLVTVKPITKALIKHQQSAPANVTSVNTSKLSAEITAVIEKIHLRVASQVRQGDVIVKLDCEDYQSRLLQQQAIRQQLLQRLEYTRSQLDRANNLKSSKNISQDLFEQRETDVAGLRSEIAAQDQVIRQHQNQIDRCTIRAPFNGVVEERLASIGELASPGTPLVTIRQTDALEVSARLRANQSISKDAKVYFEFNDKQYPARVNRISNIIDNRTRSREVRLSFTEAGAPSGAAGRLTWMDKGSWLPTDILVRRNGELGVFLLVDNIARFHVMPHAMEGQHARTDLPAQALLVVDGRQNINDGDILTVQKK